MTVLESVEKLVRRHSPAAICDDCIADKLGLSVRQHANHKTRELAKSRCFDRHPGTCVSCGREKVVIQTT